jgi:uncharacterized RDD family membrane protein YckC
VTDDAAPASFWARVAAFVLDLVITFVPVFAIVIALAGAGAGPTAAVAAGPLWTGVFLVYASVTEGTVRQATVGKRFFGIAVTGVDGRRILPGRAFGRASVKMLPFAVVGVLQQVSPVAYLAIPLPYLALALAAVTPRRQALHDLVARTLVVRANLER